VEPGMTDVALGRRRARAALLLELSLPGGAYVYQGDELGLEEVEDLPDELLQDPTWERSGHTVRGRDGCRVPIPWSGAEPPFGFGTAENPPWLPQPPSWAGLAGRRPSQLPDALSGRAVGAAS
jgi:alpha-glucosidase